MIEEKVLALHYSEPSGDEAQLRCNLTMINKFEIENFIRSGKLKGKDNLIHKDTGEVFRGPVMFVGFDREKLVNLKDNQIKAIKAIYRKAE